MHSHPCFDHRICIKCKQSIVTIAVECNSTSIYDMEIMDASNSAFESAYASQSVNRQCSCSHAATLISNCCMQMLASQSSSLQQALEAAHARPVGNGVLDRLVHFAVCCVKAVRLEDWVPAKDSLTSGWDNFAMCLAHKYLRFNIRACMQGHVHQPLHAAKTAWCERGQSTRRSLDEACLILSLWLSCKECYAACSIQTRSRCTVH